MSARTKVDQKIARYGKEIIQIKTEWLRARTKIKETKKELVKLKGKSGMGRELQLLRSKHFSEYAAK